MTMSSSNLGLVDVSSDIPPKSHLVAKGSTNFGPVDLSSDVPPVETSTGHEQ